MAKEVVWSPLARHKLKEILQYWISHNQSNRYSIELARLFLEAEQLISKHPHIGKPTTDGKARYKIVRDYLMFYEQTDDRIYILTIWDGRQDPEKLKLR